MTLLLTLLFLLAPLGTLLIIALTLGLGTERYRDRSRYLFKRAALGGAAGALLTGLVFVLRPDLALPGPGNIAMMVTVFLAVFAVTTGVLLLLRRST